MINQDQVVIENSTQELIVSTKISKGDKYLPADILLKIYNSCDDIRDKSYLMFHAEVGLRVSDIVGQKKRVKGNERKRSTERELGLEVVNIEWQNLRARVYDHKKDKWRFVYFPDKVKAQLLQYIKWRQANGIVHRQLFPFSEKTCNRILKKWCRRVGFQYAASIGSHWLRHTFIRLSRKAGRDIKAVQQNTGDTVKTLLEWYSDLSMEDMRDEIEGKPIVKA